MKSPNSYKKELFIGVPKNNLLVTGVLKNNYKDNYKIVYFEILTDILITIPWYDPSPPRWYELVDIDMHRVILLRAGHLCNF